LNPLTMVQDYRKQTVRLRAMRGARAIVTASEHIRLGLLQNGIAENHVHNVGLPVVDSTITNPSAARDYGDVADGPNASQTKRRMLSRVVFIGRLEQAKGGSLLIDAMVVAAAALKRELSLTFVGDGRERAALEAKAQSLKGHEPVVEISFTGWMEREAISAVIDQSDLLAVPSLWPEPFGLVGVEAGMRGLPAVAFDVGGITEWLEDGVNGRVVRSRPPRPGDFGAALTACLSAPVEYERLRRGARARALHFRPERHSEKLMAVLHEALQP
jgi:glycosyltransferase involved in cell wall biosynthesis